MTKTSDIKRLSHSEISINIKRYNITSNPIHWHTFYELEVVVSGDGSQIINGTKYPYRSHDAFLLGPADFHEIDLNDKAEVWLLQIEPWFMPQDFYINQALATLPIVIHLTEEDFNVITVLLTVLKNNLDKKEDEKPELTLSATHTLLLYLLGIEKKNKANPLNKRLGMIYHYLQENFRTDISIDNIARHFSLNKNYLCTYFKNETGRTIISCLRDMRLMYASSLVVISEKSTQEICENCGYNSVSHFLRDFKKKFGMSPMKMRKEHRQKTGNV